MADWTGGRTRYSQAGTAKARAGRTLMGIGSDIMAKEDEAQYNSDMTGYTIGWLKDWEDFRSYTSKNRQHPELWMPEFKKRLPEWEKNALANSTTKRSKIKIKEDFDIQVASWRNDLAEKVRMQEDENLNVNYKVIQDKSIEPRYFDTINELSDHITEFADRGSDFFDTGRVRGLTEEKFQADFRDVTVANVGNFLLQRGSEDEINNPNKFAEENSFNVFEGDLFGPDDVGELKRRYKIKTNNATRLAKEELEAKQYQKQKESYLKIRNGELTDPGVLDNMLANDEITLTAHKSLLKQMGEGPADSNDDKALFEAGKILNKVRAGEITEGKGFEEIQKLGTKLTDSKMDSKVEMLAAAAKAGDPVNSPRAKEYLGMLEKLREDGTITIEKWDELDAAMRQFITENPKGTPKEWADYYMEITKQATKSWFKKWLSLGGVTGKAPAFAGGILEKRETPAEEPPEDLIKPSDRYVLGEIVEIGGKKYELAEFREEDGEAMMREIE